METEAERNLQIETLGESWASKSDAFLIGYVTEKTVGHFHTPAIVEMQRRMNVAIAEFNAESTMQARTMIRLTEWIIALTVVLGFIALLQLVAMFRE